jgi:hypothetical protein
MSGPHDTNVYRVTYMQKFTRASSIECESEATYNISAPSMTEALRRVLLTLKEDSILGISRVI